MQRIAVIGCGGSGKSTLACQLGAILGIEVIHLDTLYWRPGWVEPPKDEWRRRVEELVRRETWILDGNYGGTLEIRLAAADTILFLDLPRTVCLWRAIRRRFQYHGKPRVDRAPGCAEQIDWPFLKWIWDFQSSRRPAMLERLERYAEGRKIIILRSSAEVRRFLDEVTLRSEKRLSQG
jgi:adenylate kinase family enzyme